MLCQTLAPAKHTKVDWRSVVVNRCGARVMSFQQDESYGLTPYDVDLFLYLPEVLDAGSIRLAPFIPRLHTQQSIQRTSSTCASPAQNHRRDSSHGAS